MTLFEDRHQKELREAGWHRRGYLPHFDERAKPQFITFHLAASVPQKVIRGWREELKSLTLSRKESYCRDASKGTWIRVTVRLISKSISSQRWFRIRCLSLDSIRYRLFSWVVMPNHVHSLGTRFERYELSDILHSLKSFTSHEANKILYRTGQFWIEDYFDRCIRNQEHFEKTVKYIEDNPVKAGLCVKPEDWPYGSAWFKKQK